MEGSEGDDDNRTDYSNQGRSSRNQDDLDPSKAAQKKGNQGITDNDTSPETHDNGGSKLVNHSPKAGEEDTSHNFTRLTLDDFRGLAEIPDLDPKEPLLLYYEGEVLKYQSIKSPKIFLPENKKCLNALLLLLKRSYSDELVIKNATKIFHSMEITLQDYSEGNVPITQELLRALFGVLDQESAAKSHAISYDHQDEVDRRTAYSSYPAYAFWNGCDRGYDFNRDSRGYYYHGTFYPYPKHEERFVPRVFPGKTRRSAVVDTTPRLEDSSESRKDQARSDLGRSEMHIKKIRNQSDLSSQEEDSAATSSEASSITDPFLTRRDEDDLARPPEQVLRLFNHSKLFLAELQRPPTERKLIASLEKRRREKAASEQVRAITLAEAKTAASRIIDSAITHAIGREMEHMLMKSEEEHSLNYRTHIKEISAAKVHNNAMEAYLAERAASDSEPEGRGEANFHQATANSRAETYTSPNESNRRGANKTRRKQRKNKAKAGQAVEDQPTTHRSDSSSAHVLATRISSSEDKDFEVPSTEIAREEKHFLHNESSERDPDDDPIAEYARRRDLAPLVDFIASVDGYEFAKEYVRAITHIAKVPFYASYYFGKGVLEALRLSYEASRFLTQAIRRRIYERWDEMQQAEQRERESIRARDIAAEVFNRKLAFKKNWEEECERLEIKNPMPWQEAWKQQKILLKSAELRESNPDVRLRELYEWAQREEQQRRANL